MYKRILYLLLVIVALPLIGSANLIPEGLFASGNQHYTKGEFAKAVASYRQLVDSGYHSSELYYNLGNAYYKIDEIPSAILYYEKAYKLTPGDEDIKVNLQLANLKITDKIEVVPEFFIAKWWHGLVMIFSLSTWSVLTVIAFITGSALLVIYLFSTVMNIKKAAFYSGIALILLGISCMFMASSQSSYLERSSEAIVFNGAVEVKSGPQKRMKTLLVIHEGLKVSIKDEEDGWYKVALPNGNIGWIESGTVKEI